MARICIIEDGEIMGESLCDRMALEGFAYDWHRRGEPALAALRGGGYALAISDIRLPDLSGDALFRQLLDEHVPLPPFIFITGFGDIDAAVRLLKLGAQDYLTKPFDLDALIDKVRVLLAVPGGTPADAILGISPEMRRIEAMLPRLAGSNASVLIIGESGAGKERVAQALHRLGKGEGRPFVAVNCGALTESLLEAELFGYEKGAFTGAVRTKKGVIEQADGGTLFLDEIGDMPLVMQVKLLRAIQERYIVRVGGEAQIPFDLRLVCATHRDLKALVTAGEFREDLYYRINVIGLRIPPLRERREDILWLARRFLEEMAAGKESGCCVLQPATERALLEYPWPGNIRELKNALERACVLSDGRTLAPEAIFENSPAQSSDHDDNTAFLGDYLAERERRYIIRTLDAHQWRMQPCADALGISRKTLWEKIRKLGIEKT